VATGRIGTTFTVVLGAAVVVVSAMVLEVRGGEATVVVVSTKTVGSGATVVGTVGVSATVVAISTVVVVSSTVVDTLGTVVDT